VKNLKKIILISAVVLAMALLAVNTLSADVPASVNVPKSCGIVVTAGSPIAFGDVATGTTSSAQTVSIKNKGSAPSTSFTVYGTAWTGGTGMSVGQTSVNDGTWKTLTLTPGITIYTGVISNGETKQPQFNVTIPEGQAQALYSQTITFTAGC
jgi:hypothetical protein